MNNSSVLLEDEPVEIWQYTGNTVLLGINVDFKPISNCPFMVVLLNRTSSKLHQFHIQRFILLKFTIPKLCKIENNTWQNPYHMPYHPEKPISSRGHLGQRDDIGRG